MRGWGDELVVKETQAQLPEPASGTYLLLVTPVPRDLMFSSGIQWCLHMYGIHINKNENQSVNQHIMCISLS